MRTAILVIAYNRPKYLYVTLDSIFRIHDLSMPVFCYIDGKGDRKKEVIDVAKSFDVIVKSRQENLGTLYHLTLSLKDVFANTRIDEVVYIEEDLLVRPDILEYASSAPRDTCFLNFCGKRERVNQEYRSLGNLIAYENFNELYEYVSEKEYVGKVRVGFGEILDEDTRGHDPVYYRFLIDKDKKTRFSNKPYVGHFGIRGKNFGKFDDEATRIENKIFSGNKKQWVENVIEVLRDERHSRLIPEGFDYG